MNKNIFKLYENFVCIIALTGNTIYLFQAYKIWQTQSAHDVTMIGFLISSISTTNWLIYGFLIKDKALLISNLFGFVNAMICLTMIYLYS